MGSLALACLLAASAVAALAQAGVYTPANCKADAVAQHNFVRSMHQAPPLTWNDTMSSTATAWAKTLAAQRCSLKFQTGILSNVYAFAADGNASSPCTSATLGWYTNVPSWNYSRTPLTDNHAILDQAATFALVLWANASQFGCGAAQGPDGCWSVVCNYNDAGQGNPTEASVVNNVLKPVLTANMSDADSCNSKLLTGFNTRRADHGSIAMSWDPLFTIAAQAWANHIAQQGCPSWIDSTASNEYTLTWGPGQQDVAACEAFADFMYTPVSWYKFTLTPWTDNQDQKGLVVPFVTMISKHLTTVGCGRATGADGCLAVACWFDQFTQEDATDSVLAANVQPLSSAPTAEQQQCQQVALTKYNQYRADHAAPALTWNENIAAGAQAFAATVVNSRCNNSFANVLPEEYELKSTNATLYTTDICGTAVDFFYSNSSMYNYTATPLTDNIGINDSLSSFTQLIWKNTTQVGCGSAQGPDGCWVVYCRYDPPGNTPLSNDAFLQNVLPIGSSPQSTAASDAAAPSTDSSSSGKSKTAIVVGTCVAAGVVIACLAGFLFWNHRRKQNRHKENGGKAWGAGKAPLFGQENNTTTGSTASTGRSDNTSQYPAFTVQPTPKGASHMMAIPGLMTGEPFTRGTAFEYTWNSSYNAMSDVTKSVESGVNDMQLDALVHSSSGQAQECPVVSLSKEQVKEQLQLLTTGLRGRGGAALVFKALWPSRFGPDALLAVKVLKDGYDCNPYVLQSFMHEASVLASVRHPNVVKLYGYCLDPPNVCLIMELLPCSLKEVLYGGHDAAANTSVLNTASSLMMAPSVTTPGLTNKLAAQMSVKDGVPLTMSQVLQVSTEVAAGLAYLHDQPAQPLKEAAGKVLPTLEEAEEGATDLEEAAGTSQKIVHRDLKPANILINSLGQVKISDFGLARRHDSTTIETRHVGAGTVPYQAPEILSGARAGALGMKATNRCDVYSMAMIFWELLSKKPPWKDLNEVNIITQVIGGKRPELPAQEKSKTADSSSMDLTQLPASLTALPAYNDIIRQCWAQRDWRRPTAADAHKLLVELQQKYQALETAAARVQVVIAEEASK